MWSVLESQNTFTPLGIRFWDPVIDEQVGEALHVRAWPEDAQQPIVQASRTRSNIYAFGRLPGMRTLESGPPRAGTPTRAGETESPPANRSFVVEVSDIKRRYLDVGFRVDLPLPYRGVFLLNGSLSPPQVSPKGFHLYSAPTRTLPPATTVIRGELEDQWTGGAAANAVIRITAEDESIWYALADQHGHFAAVLPYPTLIDGLGASPPADGRTLSSHSWQLLVEVLYEPAHVDGLPGTELKDYPSVLTQSAANVWSRLPEHGGSPRPDLTTQIRFGEELTLRTDGLAALRVSPASSPP